MGARYYDAALSRFISADTVIASLANPQSLNRYSYVYNNPVNNTDPTGHRVCEDDDCNGGRGPRSTNPSKGHTKTNKPGGSNTTPAKAKSAKEQAGKMDRQDGAQT